MPELQKDEMYRVQMIDEDMQFVATERYDTEVSQWVYMPECPTEQCITGERAGEKIVVQPCKDCTIRCQHWASWARTLLLIIDREYATSPEPEPWTTHAVTWEEDGTQKVGKGKNAHIIRTTRKREIEYRIVSFDVSLPTHHKAESTPHQARADEEKQANWLTLASKDQIIYKRMAFKDIEKHYTQHPRLLARCEQAGGKFTEMDNDFLREYHIEDRPDGTKAVVSKIVPYARYVPMLREKKQPVIRKVIASTYEHNQSEGETPHS
jgi:hypothetical protein